MACLHQLRGSGALLCQSTSGPGLLSPPEGSAAVPTWASQGPWAPMRVTSLAEAFRREDGLAQCSVENTQRELQKTQTSKNRFTDSYDTLPLASSSVVDSRGRRCGFSWQLL